MGRPYSEERMSKADSIRERMEAALNRIETAVEKAEKRREAASGLGELDPGAAAERVATAEADSARLQGELEILEGNHAALREITDTVSERLDSAIGELRAVLES